ncbi:hypothetical protein NC651_032050 [Populus alba x Populus x berolinensis]|nr:hypothetical protein NC651_032050 [Populus alba x Populus x berolinensis]
MKVMGLNMLALMAYGTWNPEAKSHRPRPSNQQFLEERPNRASDPVKSLIYFNMASRPYKYERDTKLGPMFSVAISQPECKT